MIQKTFGTIICGGGPAGIGLLVYAAKNGMLNNMLKEGLALIEKTEFIGGGSLLNYDINSNTLAKVLLEAFETSNSENELLLSSDN